MTSVWYSPGADVRDGRLRGWQGADQDRRAVTFVGGRTFTVSELWLAVAERAGDLTSAGLRKGDRLCLMQGNGPDFVLDLLAATGLVLWIIYVASDSDGLAWAAVIVLAPVAILGFSMLAIWVQRRRATPAATSADGEPAPAEQHFPVPLVVGHGLLAVTTLTLAILAAAGVGS